MRAGFRVCLLLLLFTGLVACRFDYPRDEDSPHYSVQAGAELVLNQKLDIRPEHVSVYLQYGKLTGTPGIDRFRPYCKFEIYTMADSWRSVEPDTFRITRVEDGTEMVGIERMPMASLSLATDMPATVTYATSLYLESPRQPDVYRLTCMHWDDYNRTRYLSISEMRSALGEVFSLRLND
jgi:hypothetical protein